MILVCIQVDGRHQAALVKKTSRTTTVLYDLNSDHHDAEIVWT